MAGGFSSIRLARVRVLLEGLVDSGFVPGALAVLARHGEVRCQATGRLAFEGAARRRLWRATRAVAAEDLTAIFALQRARMGDQRLPLWPDLWTAVYQAIDD